MVSQTLSIDARMLFSSGVGTYLQNLLKRIRFESLGVKVRVFVHDQKGGDWIRQYQPDAQIKTNPVWIYGLKEQLYWRQHLDGKGAFWSPHFNIPWGGYEKLITTVHDCFPLTVLAPPLMKLYGRAMFGRIRRKADVILTVSEFSRHELQQRAHIYDAPIYVISNGVDPRWFVSSLPPRPYPFSYFVYVGSLKPHKNLKNLLKAYEKIKPTQKLVAIGQFKSLKYRDDEAYRLLTKNKESIIVTDYVDEEVLRATVKHSDGLILPSFYEGFGLPPLEAMASRVPVLVSQTASLPEVCGDSALYCDPFSVDGLVEGLNDLIALSGPERAKKIAEGYDHAAQYNWDRSAQATFEVFKSTLL